MLIKVITTTDKFVGCIVSACGLNLRCHSDVIWILPVLEWQLFIVTDFRFPILSFCHLNTRSWKGSSLAGHGTRLLCSELTTYPVIMYFIAVMWYTVKTLFFRCILISRFSYVENSLRLIWWIFRLILFSNLSSKFYHIIVYILPGILHITSSKGWCILCRLTSIPKISVYLISRFYSNRENLLLMKHTCFTVVMWVCFLVTDVKTCVHQTTQPQRRPQHCHYTCLRNAKQHMRSTGNLPTVPRPY